MIDLTDPRHERALRQVNMLMAEARILFRTVGPKVEGPGSQEKLAIMHCPRCTPPPRVYECPKCEYETLDRWRMKLHNIADPQWCNDAMRRRANAWAQGHDSWV